MAQIRKFKANKGPREWLFVDPDTSRSFKGATKTQVFNEVVDYRIANKLSPIQHLGDIIEDYTASMPINEGKWNYHPLRRGWLQTFKGGVALLENIFFGEANMVSQEEAERRAAICVSCPHNIFPDKSGFVAWADAIAEHSTDGRKTSRDSELGNCEVCTCVLKAKVHYRGPFDSNSDFPNFCWQRGKPKQ